jgi:3-oxoacyl-[acyl-carrier protein] reductase
MKQTKGKRTALVTGASRGLGRAIAVKLGASGMDVAVNYLNGSRGAEEACTEIRGHGSRAIAIQVDVRSESEVAALVRQAKDALGEIDVLVVNATGPQPMLPIEGQSWPNYLDQLEFFVKSPLLLVQQVKDGMRKQKLPPRFPLSY